MNLGRDIEWTISGDILPAVNFSSREAFIYRE